MFSKFKLMSAVISVSFILITACSGGDSNSKGKNESEKKGESILNKGLDSDFANQITAHTWCIVDESGEPFYPNLALAFIYKKNGNAIKNRLHIKDKANWVDESVAATWGYSNSKIAIKDYITNEITSASVEWIQYSPNPSKDAIWASGVTLEEQTCLKVQVDSEPNNYGVHCKCDFDKIKNQK